MDKKIFCTICAAIVTSITIFDSIITSKNDSLTTSGEDCAHVNVEHYNGVNPTTGRTGKLEHWACCTCHKAFYDEDLKHEIVGADTDRSIINITKKTVHSWYGKENVTNDEIINISTSEGDVNCLTQTDWGNYSTGIGAGTYYYYVSDSHPSVYLDAESMLWTPSYVTSRDANNNGYSTFKFNTSLSSLSKISFDYKYWDMSYEPDDNGNHISMSTSDNPTQKYAFDLIPDNNWHSMVYTFDSPVAATKLIFDIYHFVGEMYISNLHYNVYEIDAGDAYDISVDSSWASKHIAQFGLVNNDISSSAALYPQSESCLKVIRDGKTYNGGTISAPLITKDNDNQYTVDSWWLLHKTGLTAINNGDILVIEGVFTATCGETTYLLNIPKVEIIFVSTNSYAYAHYVNHSGEVLSDLVTSTKTTYRWFMTTANNEDIPLGATYKPTMASNFRLNGINVANTGLNGLYQSETDKGEICVLDTDQGFSSLKIAGAKLEIEGYFVNSSDANNYVYIPLTTFYYDGTSVYRIYSDIDTSSFKVGIWNGNHHFGNDEALTSVAEAGIDEIYAVNPIWNSNWDHTMELANTLGVKFYCDPREWDYENSCYKEWDQNKPSYMDNESIAGLVVYDEPSIEQFDTIKAYKQSFDTKIGGDKKMFVNLLCSFASETSLYGSEEYSTNDKYASDYAEAYTKTYDADMYAFDSYGLLDNGTARKSFYCDLDVWSHFAKQDGKGMYYTILTSAHDSGDGYHYATPTLQTMRWKYNLGMAFGAESIIHYLFATSSDDYDAIADDDGNIINQDLYDIVKTVNTEVKNWDEIYSQYTWNGYAVHDTGSNNQMFQKLAYDSSLSDIGVSSISSSENLIVGSFTDSASQKAYLVTNAGRSTYSSILKYNKYIDNSNFSMQSTSATITFDKSYSKVIVIHNGEKTLKTLNSNQLTLDIDAYDGMFVIPF